jgi:hypothetical protein
VTVDWSSTRIDLVTAGEPELDPSAVVDPHWLQLRGDSLLPTIYMPAQMKGSHPIWLRGMALILIGVFMLATVLGVCLTYGPPTGW